MATTLSTLRTRLAYRLGEDSAPSDTNETARRDSFINEGYRKLLSEQYWWFCKTIGSQATVNGQEIYTLPSTFRDMIELRSNRKLLLPIDETDAQGTYNYPPLYYSYRAALQRFYVYGEQELHLLPASTSTPTTFTLSSLTQTSGTATATTSTAHGLQANDYVLIAGAAQTDYNGTQRVLTVPTTTTLTFAVSSSATSPATGTITMIWQNLVYRFWSYPSALSASSDTVVIPDQFADILVAYAFGRYGFIDDSRGSSADGFEEYNRILKDLQAENLRRKLFHKETPPLSHEFYQE